MYKDALWRKKKKYVIKSMTQSTPIVLGSRKHGTKDLKVSGDFGSQSFHLYSDVWNRFPFTSMVIIPHSRDRASVA